MLNIWECSVYYEHKTNNEIKSKIPKAIFIRKGCFFYKIEKGL